MSAEDPKPITAEVCPPGTEAKPDLSNLPALVDSTPAAMLHLAVSKGLDVDSLAKLMELYERYEANQAHKAFVSALADFQAETPPLARDCSVSYGNTKYKHASLGAIAESIRKGLHDHGLSYRFQINNAPSEIAVSCIVTHTAGHSEVTTMSAPSDSSGSKNAIQSLASSVTYLERYTLIAALGLTTADDDTDGRQERQEPQRQTPNGRDNAFDRGDAPTATPRPATGTSQPAQASAGAVYMGTEGQPIQVTALKPGMIVQGTITKIDPKYGARLEHVNANIQRERQDPQDRTSAQFPWPDFFVVGACVRVPVIYAGMKGQHNDWPLLVSGVPMLVTGDPASPAPAAPTPPPAQKPDPREKSLAACKEWIAYLGDRSLDLQKTHFGVNERGEVNAPETADLAHLNAFWADATKLDKAPKEEPKQDSPMDDNPPF